MTTTRRHIIVTLTDRTAPYHAGTRHYGQYLVTSLDTSLWVSVPASQYSPYDALRALAAAACKPGTHPTDIHTECVCHNFTDPWNEGHIKDHLDWTTWAISFNAI